MENWDDAQLAEVVERRHGEDNRKKNATQIVSLKFENSLKNNSFSRYANISLKLLRVTHTGGFGVVVSSSCSSRIS
jgi:hypothetical protein